jgi:hypothetical protein
MISTRNLRGLGDVNEVRRILESLAMLNAVLWRVDRPTYAFDAQWGGGLAVGEMSNGQGDSFVAAFSEAGCWLKGFAHEAALSPFRWVPPRVAAGMFDGMPEAFREHLAEPAFEVEATTFCIWRRTGDGAWGRGPVVLPGAEDVDGSADLLRLMDGQVETCWRWAEESFERQVSRKGVEAVMAHERLKESLVRELNEEVTLEEVREEAEGIGYPL